MCNNTHSGTRHLEPGTDSLDILPPQLHPIRHVDTGFLADNGGHIPGLQCAGDIGAQRFEHLLGEDFAGFDVAGGAQTTALQRREKIDFSVIGFLKKYIKFNIDFKL